MPFQYEYNGDKADIKYFIKNGRDIVSLIIHPIFNDRWVHKDMWQAETLEVLLSEAKFMKPDISENPYIVNMTLHFEMNYIAESGNPLWISLKDNPLLAHKSDKVKQLLFACLSAGYDIYDAIENDVLTYLNYLPDEAIKPFGIVFNQTDKALMPRYNIEVCGNGLKLCVHINYKLVFPYETPDMSAAEDAGFSPELVAGDLSPYIDFVNTLNFDY